MAFSCRDWIAVFLSRVLLVFKVYILIASPLRFSLSVKGTGLEFVQSSLHSKLAIRAYYFNSGRIGYSARLVIRLPS